MVYSADGQRLIRRDPTGATLYLPSTEVRWTKATDSLSSTQYYSFNGTPVAVRTGVEAADLVITDPHGTGQIGINAYTQDYSRRRSDLFGNVRQTAGPWGATNHGFVDGVIDASTRLTHLGAREYDSKMGRFISVDPVMDLSDPQSLNGYSYGNSNPLVYTDPAGTQNESLGDGGLPPPLPADPPPTADPEPDTATDEVPTGSSDSHWEQIGNWKSSFDRTVKRKARELGENTADWITDNPSGQQMAASLGKKFYEDTKEEIINWTTACGSASNSAVCKIRTAGIAFWLVPGGGIVSKPAVRPVVNVAVKQAEKVAAKNAAGESSIRVYRVEGPGNKRLDIDSAGDVSIKGRGMLFLNFGDEARAQRFLANRLSQGHAGTTIKSFAVPTSYYDDLVSRSVPERMARMGSVVQVDVNQTTRSFGLRSSEFPGLQCAIIPGSGC
ncbi:RHS repeat-associated core domain-containing protein [Kribbella deserti]|uniref:RHS repeat-associated core domain-containing protein n=1 Tax=Kribbella deserti TaxID=1926257 RepID=A0ABV6QX97_9ACTN